MKKRKMEMNKEHIISVSNLFEYGALNPKSFYIYTFDIIPSTVGVQFINGEAALKGFEEKYEDVILSKKTFTSINQKRKMEFGSTMLVLSNRTILSFSNEYCEILHSEKQSEFVKEVSLFIAGFKRKVRRKPFEINLIVSNYGNLELKAMEINRTKLDLDMFYNDDFIEVHKTIKQRLSKKNDKGIILLHGKPGTGKTTYLRYLIGNIKKKVLFLSPNLAKCITNPDFFRAFGRQSKCGFDHRRC